MMTPTPKHEQALARAIAVGARLFAQQGYSDTTTRQLSAAMGVTNGTFYHHFESKEELLRRICEEALKQIAAEVTSAVAAAGDPLDRLKSLVRTHVAVIANSQATHTTMLTELRSLTGKHRSRVLAARHEYEQLVLEVIATAQRDGHIRADMDPATQMLLLLNLMNWTIFWYRSEGSMTPDELAEQMLTVFLDGVRPRTEYPRNDTARSYPTVER